MNAPVLTVENLRVHFSVKQKDSLFGSTTVCLRAVDGVSFEMRPGETLGVVGESGCGKSTLGRAILRLVAQTAGRVVWCGDDLQKLGKREMDRKRMELQIVFQDPLSSLNPRMTIGDTIGEPLRVFRPELTRHERSAAVREMMAAVGLEPDLMNRYPHEFSGGQCQRVGIARAMILKPKLVVCDEPVSALDVSTQAQIVALLKRLQKETGTAILFISHDLSVVRMMCSRILVMYLGRVAEIADRDELFDGARHPYTRALMSAVPIPDPSSRQPTPTVLTGEVPSPMDPPQGCVFHTRCPNATPRCRKEVPPLHAVSATHQSACHMVESVTTPRPVIR